MKNTFWISTAPRTGSMWLFNVAREIFIINKYNVFPAKIPKNDKPDLVDELNDNLNVCPDSTFIVLVPTKLFPNPLVVTKAPTCSGSRPILSMVKSGKFPSVSNTPVIKLGNSGRPK